MQRFGLVAALLCAVGHATVVSSGHDVQERHVDASKQCSYYMEGPAFAAEKYGKYFGTATAVGQWSDKPYTDILDNEAFFGSLTPSMGMKWDDLAPGDGWFDFADADAIANRAADNGQPLRCHTLVWPYQALPEWLTSRDWQRQELIDVMWRHITTVVNRYKGRCQAWDVVNEALLEDGSLRPSIFLDVIGPEYITIAFQAAREADPDVPLYYNDYNIDNDWTAPPPAASSTINPRRNYLQQRPPKKRAPAYGNCGGMRIANKIDGAKCLITMVRTHGGEVNGIGLQGHFVYNSTPSAERLQTIMQGFAEMDLDIAITELDVRMDFANINEATIEQQARGYHDVVAACRDTERCKGITLWDFTDKYSWVPSVIKGFGSAHLYDNQMVRKQKIWEAIMAGWAVDDDDAGC